MTNIKHGDLPSAKCRIGEEFSALCRFGKMSFRRSGFRQSVVHRVIHHGCQIGRFEFFGREIWV